MNGLAEEPKNSCRLRGFGDILDRDEQDRGLGLGLSIMLQLSTHWDTGWFDRSEYAET